MSPLKNTYPKQLTLPFEVLEQDLSPECMETVKQSWKVTFSRQHLTSVHAKRVMGFIAAQIKEDGKLSEFYQIPANKIISETGLDKKEVYKRMKGVVYELANVVFFFEDDEKHLVVPRHLLDTTRFQNPAGYANGKLTIAFNPQLNGFVNAMSHFSFYELQQYVNFGSWYSMRLYEILSAFKDTGWAEFNIEYYRELMGCGVELDRSGKPKQNKKTGKPKYIKYNNHFDAIERTTAEPLKEFKGTELEFTVKSINAEGSGRGRPPIVAVRFDLVNTKKTNNEKLTSWIEKSTEFKKIYDRLKKFNVSDDVIVKYSKAIGRKKLQELVSEWELRQIPSSNNKILNPEHYCNKVLSDIGKGLLENKN